MDCCRNFATTKSIEQCSAVEQPRPGQGSHPPAYKSHRYDSPPDSFKQDRAQPRKQAKAPGARGLDGHITTSSVFREQTFLCNSLPTEGGQNPFTQDKQSKGR